MNAKAKVDTRSKFFTIVAEMNGTDLNTFAIEGGEGFSTEAEALADARKWASDECYNIQDNEVILVLEVKKIVRRVIELTTDVINL